jgi:hypothetical protein
MTKRATKDEAERMMRVRRRSPSKKPVHAESMASGGTVEAIMMPVFKKRNLSGMIFEIIYAENGERIKRKRLAIMG